MRKKFQAWTHFNSGKFEKNITFSIALIHFSHLFDQALFKCTCSDPRIFIFKDSEIIFHSSGEYTSTFPYFVHAAGNPLFAITSFVKVWPLIYWFLIQNFVFQYHTAQYPEDQQVRHGPCVYCSFSIEGQFCTHSLARTRRASMMARWRIYFSHSHMSWRSVHHWFTRQFL